MAEERTLNQKGNAGGTTDGNNKKIRGEDVPERDATKRLAQQGQWRTPPLPVFAAAVSYASTPAAAASKIPTTPDEYARMLQEAYKRGAEAGARAQQPTKPTAVGVGVPPHTVQYTAPPTGAAHGANTPIMQVNSVNYTPSVVPTVVAPSDSSGVPVTKPPPSVCHSKSLPDMSSHLLTDADADDEEGKRKNRLARNRASARLRRLKKKNLVDSYEGEVGILESSLSKLRSHRWGSAIIDHEALIEALSMERGQQPLTPANRRELVQSIVTQQREQVTNLLDCQLENWVLSALEDSCADKPNQEDELTQVTSELQSILQLTPKQRSLIKNSSQGCANEVQDLFTVENCLQSIHANQWLLDEGVDGVAGQFTSILNPAQLSKFLLWSDHNADQIEKLDYVNVLSGVGSGPVFEFGVDEGLTDGD
mmetsp:Transcript_10940/g.19993  ORF Transcript_10940/g.19993 Transcript_10940/m.19993 type:complete len:423 (-) Transcript_10940:227-1495(-)